MSLDINALLASNPMLTGFLGAGAAGSLLYSAKGIAGTVWGKAKRQLTTTLEIYAQDPAFHWVTDWLSQQPAAKRARTLRVSKTAKEIEESHNYGDMVAKDWSLGPGVGDMWMWHAGGPLIIRRERGEMKMGNADEKLFLTTIGRSQKRLRDVVNTARSMKENDGSLQVSLWRGGGWLSLPSRRPRRPETLFLPPGFFEGIMDSAGWFFGAEETYAKGGIPYRLGWLLEGEPRSGKTSVVAAIASHFKRPVFFLNLASVMDDNELISAFTQADPRAIILIEDADAAGSSTRARPVDHEFLAAARDQRASPGELNAKDAFGTGITLSGLLNAIDGIVATEGRLLIMTTNFPERLDSALIGGGRVGRRWMFGLMQKPEAERMAAAFFGNKLPDSVAWELAHWEPKRAADWQEKLLRFVQH